MHTDQLPCRRLYDEILGYDGGALFHDLVQPWLAGQDAERRWLDDVRARPGQPIPPMSQEELWRLYALSRILQLLQLSFQPRAGGFGPAVAPVTAGEYARFLDALGLEAVEEADFHPFHHEIVRVDELPRLDAPPRVGEILWPGVRLGALLISRAGCRVRAGRRRLVKEIAENSTLYWASARAGRPAEDLGSGWGSNSQWRTPFRRDYALDGAYYYNVDACAPRPGPTPEDDLDATERDELLRHRCFVTSPRPGHDRWPYDLTLIEAM